MRASPRRLSIRGRGWGRLIYNNLTRLQEDLTGSPELAESFEANDTATERTFKLRKGVPRRRIILRHALLNAIGPIVNVVALNLAYLVSAS